MKTETFLPETLRIGSIWSVVLWATVIFFCQSSLSSPAPGPSAPPANGRVHPSLRTTVVSHPASLSATGWEGSAEGKAYSEFNHRLAGILVVLIALGELHGALRIAAWSWMRLLLPGAMLVGGSYLVVWSDHDAWPIGSQTFIDSFVLGETLTVQHKLYALLLLAVGGIEWLRRSGKLVPRVWSLPLPAFAVVGGGLLFLHSHGDHPAAHRIALHHLTIGVTAWLAGICLLVSEYHRGIVEATTPASWPRANWKRAWGVLVLGIGVQLLMYTE